MLLDNLSELMKRRGISNLHALANESDVPYTTLKGFYEKGCDNVKLSTLNKLCTYFNVSLDYLINGDVTNLTEHEKKVIFAYRSMDKEGKNVIDRALNISSEIVENAENKKHA